MLTVLDLYKRPTPVVKRSKNPDYTRLADQCEAAIALKLAEVLHEARIAGYVITVDLVSHAPLAMGNYQMVGHVRSVR